MAQEMGYRARFIVSPDGVIQDIFDGAHYQHLRARRVWTAHASYDHTYFSQPTDIALGLSTDGFGPFRKRKGSCWPLILFNYNLPPTIRFQLEHILCLGVIPGPKEPKEIGTFLQPLIDELDELAAGVPAWDGLNNRAFCLRAYLIACFGDMPAVAKLMCMKGPSGKRPCRACNILGVQHENGKSYAALNRPFDQNPTPYDPLNLPRRTHAQYVEQANQVDSAARDNAEDNRAIRFGINSLSPLADVPSLEFPTSFPHDFMHLIFQNVIPTLLKLWTRTKKYAEFGTGHEDYLLDKNVWSAIGEACAASGDNIPSVFGCRVPNLSEKDSFVTAEARHLFATQLAPALLLGEFKRDVYYQHFVELVRLINMCTGFKLAAGGVQEIRSGFAQWVQEYERLYYRYQRGRLRACTLPIHVLLHIADDIENMGPVWAYWSFPMERLIGSLSYANKNLRFIWASFDRHVLEITQLSQIKLIFDLTDALSLEERRYNLATGARYKSYPALVFVRPTKTAVLHSTIIKKVAKYVSNELGVDERTVRDVIQNRLDVNGRRGDTVRGNHLSPCKERVSRDSSYVKDVCDAADVPNTRVDPLILAAVSPLPTFKHVSAANMVQFTLTGGNLATPEIVDANNIDCLVGRVRTQHGAWYVVERANVVGRMDMLDAMMDPR
ncbi:hypothetical protein FRC09_007143 [Ceratobasidium sp. 395]|nr:hypothetical protein FRC09_007143 [Ceratobasidium sp. 395]